MIYKALAHPNSWYH